MPYSYVEIKQLLGLFLQPNTFQLPTGALEVAKNCTMSQDNIITKRRGFSTHYTPASGTLNNLFNYQNKLIAISNTEVRNDVSGTFGLNGTVSVTGDRISRSAEARKNLLFTTDNGVKKLTAYNSAVQAVGVPPALDIRCELVGATGIITVGNSVQYRVLFGIKDENLNLLLGAPSDIIEVTAAGTDRTPIVEASIPTEIASVNYFYQIYRSEQSSTDVTPDFKLVKQANLTAADLTAGFIYYTDTVIEALRTGAPELYTNPNSQEGELQANARPPICSDMTLFKDVMLYSDITTRHLLDDFFVASTSATYIVNDNWIEIKQGATTRRYVARAGSANNTVEATVGVVGTTATITFPAAHGLVTGDIVTVYGANGTVPVVDNTYTATVTGAAVLTITVAAGKNSTTCMIYGLRNAAGEHLFELNTTTAPANLEFTGQGISKAVNRDPSSTVYATYASSITQTFGNVVFESKTLTSDAIQMRAQNTTVGQAFSPELPASFGTTVQSEQDIKPNGIMASKNSEIEAVPIFNQILAGSENKRNLRIFALKDSVIILREDGVYRLDGDNINNFQVTILDNTVFCLSASSASLLNGQVHFLSNQGICAASSTSVEIISRNIELPISAVLGNSNLAAQTGGAGYETDRLFILTTLAPRENTATECYVFNTITRAWSTWDTYFKEAVVGPGDKLYYITLDNKVKIERKNQNRLDYCDQDYPITVTSVAAGNLSAVITSASVVPEAGDVIEKDNTLSRISSVSGVGPSYTVHFDSQTTLIAGDTETLYTKIVSTIKHAPFHAGEVGRGKQFAQMQLHSRDNSFTFADINFSNNVYAASISTSWRTSSVRGVGLGWGALPWGFFPWGLDNTINLNYNTQASTPVRIYIPLEAQRGNWIQAVIEHRMGGEQMNIQALTYAVRGYGERVTR